MLTVSFALKQIIGKSIVFCAVYKSYVYTVYATLASGVTGISYESLISSWYRDEPLADCVQLYMYTKKIIIIMSFFLQEK